MRCCLILLALPVLFFRESGATKPTVTPKSPNARNQIESLRHHSGLDQKATKERLQRNLSRDCRGHAYASTDLDLTVESVLKTYPVQAVLAHTKGGRSLCPANAKRVADVLKDQGATQEAGRFAVRYLKAFEGFKAYPWSSDMWNHIPLIRLLPCTPEGAKALAHLVSGYSYSAPLPKVSQEWESRCGSQTSARPR